MSGTRRAQRVAVVGAAGWAGSRHARAFAAAGAEVAFLIDTGDRAASLARELGAALLPDAAALQREQADLVVVALPSRMQPRVCADLLERGFRVLSEKPVSADLEGASTLAGARDVDERLMVGYTLHQHPAAQHVKAWVAENDVIAVSVRSVAHKQSLTSWRADPREGGVTVVNGIHAIELVSSWFEGEPKVLSACNSSRLYGSPVPEHMMSTLVFPEGAVFALQSYWSPWAEPQGLNQGDWSLTIDIVASSGRLLWSNDTVRVWTLENGNDEKTFDPSDLFFRQAEAALRFCQGEAPAVGFTQALRATAIADALLAAATSDKEVVAP